MRRYAPYGGLAAALLALVALVVVARSDSNDDPAASIQPPTTSATTGQAKTGPTTTSAPPLSPYELAPTRRCLRSAGVEVSAVRSTDSRLRALGDLAQRTSLELKFGGRGLGLAFGDARLLRSLLLVPNDPYRLEVRRNVLLMYPPSARDEAALVRRCLRP